jgi:hypothetical protein
MVASRESAALAEVLIRQTCAKQGIGRDQLTIHADRGSSMTSKPVAFLLADLGITQSHSRPHVSDDNPFSEAQFKTLKYRPDFPARFDSIEAARLHCQVFFPWYNDEHRHSGLGLHTPADIHYGLAETIRDKRAAILTDAYTAHPERFVRNLGGVRQWTESVNQTLKSQLDLEDHGGRTPAGVFTRVAQRLLAMAAGIWHNWTTGVTSKRTLTAYDH